jgi:hypothetical protein
MHAYIILKKFSELSVELSVYSCGQETKTKKHRILSKHYFCIIYNHGSYAELLISKSTQSLELLT